MEGVEDVRFPEEMLNVLLARQRFQSILEPKAFFYLSFLCDLLSYAEFRCIFMKMQGWKQVNRLMGKVPGVMIDTQSSLGIFMRSSVLGQNRGHYHQEKEVHHRL